MDENGNIKRGMIDGRVVVFESSHYILPGTDQRASILEGSLLGFFTCNFFRRQRVDFIREYYCEEWSSAYYMLLTAAGIFYFRHCCASTLSERNSII